jgi:hypothetical protein
MSDELIWYASYGSNMDAGRLRSYLEGGSPPGAVVSQPGARDPSPPRDVRPVSLAGSVYFAWDSPTWGGGIAFYDPLAPGTSVGRAYLLTRAQLSDVAAMEMHRPPGDDLDLTELLAAGSSSHGPGRYETLHVVGSLDEIPVVTFTSSEHDVPHRAPTAPYLATMGRGLRDGHGWTASEAASYLLDRPGIGPEWTAADIADLVA